MLDYFPQQKSFVCVYSLAGQSAQSPGRIGQVILESSLQLGREGSTNGTEKPIREDQSKVTKGRVAVGWPNKQQVVLKR